MTPVTKWAVLGDSCTGTSHRTRNTPCQDAFRYEAFGEFAEWLVIAVADGAGSAAHSEIGAKLVCDEFISRVPNIEPDKLANRDEIIELFATVRDTVIAEAERLNAVPRELACTVLLCVIGPMTATFAQLGDGAIVVRGSEEFRTVFWPEPSEYANATDFLTEDRFREAIQFATMSESICELAVLTDGLQRLALDFTTRQPHRAFFQPFFERLRVETEPTTLVEPFREFLDSARVNDRTDDDKTLVIAIRQQ